MFLVSKFRRAWILFLGHSLKPWISNQQTCWIRDSWSELIPINWRKCLISTHAYEDQPICDSSLFLKVNEQQLSLWPCSGKSASQSVSYSLTPVTTLLQPERQAVSASTLLLCKVHQSLNTPFPKTLYHFLLSLIYNYGPPLVNLMVKDGQYPFLPTCYS